MFRMMVAALLLLTLALPPAAAQLQAIVSFTDNRPTYGTTERVICNGISCTPCTYSWTGPPGVDVSNTESDGSIIVLSMVGHSHRGDYNCTVMDGNGDSASVIGILVVVPAITEAPVDHVVQYGDGTTTASFNCTANGGTSPPSLSFIWTTDTGIDTMNVMETPNPDGTTTSILSLTNVDARYCGDYACDVAYSDVPDEENYASATLTVVPAIVEGPLNQPIPLGGNVTLNCTARGGTITDLVFTWIGPPNVTLPDPDTSDNGDGSITSVLTLTEVDISYSGNYTCHVGCTMGTVETASATANLYAPAPEDVQTVTFSSTEIFVFWSPPPEIDQNGVIVDYEVEYDPQETFGGMIGTNSVNTNDGMLLHIVLSGLEENVEYSIRVRAYTYVGPGPYSPAVLSTTLMSVPDTPPQNVQAETLSSTEILVSWEEVPAINQNGEIVLYEIMYTPLMTFGGVIGTNYATTNGSVLEMTLTGLDGFVEYNIAVRAYTIVGAGPFSPTVSNTTLEVEPDVVDGSGARNPVPPRFVGDGNGCPTEEEWAAARAAVLQDIYGQIVTQFGVVPSPLIGETAEVPATSCQQIAELAPTSPSGYYWILDPDSERQPTQMFCTLSN